MKPTYNASCILYPTIIVCCSHDNTHIMSHISNHEPSAEEPYNVQPPSYTNAGEMRPNDDWSEITDRKLKKRMQNRVAQRTYRDLP